MPKLLCLYCGRWLLPDSSRALYTAAGCCDHWLCRWEAHDEERRREKYAVLIGVWVRI